MIANFVVLWDHYWPVLAAALAIGIAVGWLAFRLDVSLARHRAALTAGAVASLAVAALWHGPLGAGEKFAGFVETAAAAELRHLEMAAVEALVQRGPLNRTLVLAGPADAFQRRELPRYMLAVPGVAEVRWRSGGGAYPLPLIGEVAFGSLTVFLIGLLLAYLLELRRRARAGWRW